MRYTTRGIVIHSVRYGDTAAIVSMLTEDHGLQSYMVRGVYKPRSRFPAALFTQLNLLEVEADDQCYGTLQHPREIRIEEPYLHMHSDMRKSSVCLFLAEVLHQSIRHTEENRLMFGFVRESLMWYDTTGSFPPLFHHWFLLQLTSFLGFFPSEPEAGQSCFNLAEGRFQSSEFPRNLVVDREPSALLAELLKTRPAQLAELRPAKEIHAALLVKILEYYRYHLDHFREIRSHQVLISVFS
jgi:DNA repair protein RecO (recombination protein O)